MGLFSRHLNNALKINIGQKNRVWNALAELYNLSISDQEAYEQIAEDLFETLSSLPILEGEISFDDLEKQYASIIRKKILAARVTGVANKKVPKDPTLTPEEKKEYKNIQGAGKTGIIIAPTRDEMTAIQAARSIQQDANAGVEAVKDYQKLENERQELVKKLVKANDPALKGELKETEQELRQKLAEINKRIEEPFRIDKDKFVANITAEPGDIFSQNEKMSKTTKTAGGKKSGSFVYETGIPAFKGLVYDEKTGKFDIVKTCPSAGQCILFCYARKGYYAMAQKPLKLTQRLNLLINKPERYKEKAIEELVALAKEHSAYEGSENTLVIRWNDAGDFFSRGNVNYLDTAKAVMKAVKGKEINGKKIQIKGYAYTKDAENLKDDSEILWNFSAGGKKSKAEGIDMKTHKTSAVVDKSLFDEFFVGVAKGYKKDSSGNIAWAPGKTKQELIKKIFNHYKDEYDLTLGDEPGKSKLIMQADLPAKEDPTKHRYAVVVAPTGDSDIGAQRKDVKTMFLLIH